MSKLIPVGYRVSVKLDEVEETEELSEGGIILRTADKVKQELDTTESNYEEGVVASIGCAAFKDLGDGTAWCKVGDRVKFVRYAGVRYNDEESGDSYRIMNDRDVVAIVEV